MILSDRRTYTSIGRLGRKSPTRRLLDKYRFRNVLSDSMSRGPGRAVSALSFLWALVFLIISLAAGFTVAGTVLVAHNKGADNVHR